MSFNIIIICAARVFLCQEAAAMDELVRLKSAVFGAPAVALKYRATFVAREGGVLLVSGGREYSGNLLLGAHNRFQYEETWKRGEKAGKVSSICDGIQIRFDARGAKRLVGAPVGIESLLRAGLLGLGVNLEVSRYLLSAENEKNGNPEYLSVPKVSALTLLGAGISELTYQMSGLEKGGITYHIRLKYRSTPVSFISRTIEWKSEEVNYCLVENYEEFSLGPAVGPGAFEIK